LIEVQESEKEPEHFMGCDIHAYVEYRKREPVDDYELRWRDFGGRINPERNYRIFGKLAGVRRDVEVLVAPVRGLPDDLGWQANGDYWLWISYSGESGEGVVTSEQAAKWHGYGRRYRGKTTSGEHVGKPTHIEDPDWHTPSWVTPDEWERALDEDATEIEYHAMLAAMRRMEQSGYLARVVFWFDN
jgi:hypothetical protein